MNIASIKLIALNFKLQSWHFLLSNQPYYYTLNIDLSHSRDFDMSNTDVTIDNVQLCTLAPSH